mmetsp:Transcript_115836/g.360792  ORF Transcript_115836/g.360792 Transcript_115836/m.360792 type:complete len:352 (+) Transcript_115836:65-1120(+)
MPALPSFSASRAALLRACPGIRRPFRQPPLLHARRAERAGARSFFEGAAAATAEAQASSSFDVRHFAGLATAAVALAFHAGGRPEHATARADTAGVQESCPRSSASDADADRCKRPTVLLLVRHGERLDYVDPAWLPANRAGEPWNPPLSDAGKEQAEALPLAVDAWCQKLGVQLGAVYSSPLLRTRQTAQPTAARFGLDVRPVPNLLEWLAAEFYTAWACQDSTGHWGSGTTGILQQYEDVVRRPASRSIGMRGGPENHLLLPESQQDMVERVGGCVEELAAAHPGQLLLVVGHGGPTTYTAQHLAGDGGGEGSVPFAGYTGVFVLTRQPGQQQWQLLACNDQGHLRSPL